MSDTDARRYLLSTLVDDAADVTPDATALIDGEESWDYQALADQIGRLTGALADEGIRAGDRVAIFAEKSMRTYAAMHAVIRAGAIAVPVNRASPPAALDALVAATAPRAVVLDAATASRWPTTGDALEIGAQTERAASALSWDDVASADPAPPVSRTGSDPAYLITTSGSTGRPKSIVHTHRSALRYAEIAASCFGIHAGDRLTNVAAFHFDQSTFELYAAPLVGASVILVPDAALKFPASVARLLERHDATVWYSVPSILSQLLERGALEDRDLTSLRWVIFGGEVFPPVQLRRLMALLPDARFSNSYGPAEVNQCTFHHLSIPPADGESVPIGEAWDDTEVRLRDGDTDVPGVGAGELQVLTATVMAGYWDAPDLTEAAFVTECGPGALRRRWYRTGDLVERDAAGLLHFRGRLDRQAKIRGVRVELESVETVMNSAPGIDASAAVLADGTLIGLVQTDEAADLGPVRRHLAEQLTPEARPTELRIVAALPRTGSGKVDHRAAEALARQGSS